jgi:hypothetical protein
MPLHDWKDEVPPSVAAPQLPTHAPATHALPAGHDVPHAPQFVAEVWMSTHPASPHAVSPAPRHEVPQVPLAHTWSRGHSLAHAPQLFRSDMMSAYVSPHAWYAPLNGATKALTDVQTPSMHAWPRGHAVPQVPQLSASVRVLVQPLPHWVRSPQFGMQLPWTHGLSGGHSFPHAPQFLGSVSRSASAPRHAAYEAGGVNGVHTLSRQSCPLAQLVPSAPQF